MKIVITGGAGYIGSILVEEIFKHNDILNSPNVVIIDNMLYKQDSLFHFCSNKNFRILNADVNSKEALDELIDADFVIPLAAIVGFSACDKDVQLSHRVNTAQLEKILYYKNTYNNDLKVIFPNTNSGYGNKDGSLYCTEESPLEPLTNYGVQKCRAEDTVILNMNGVSLRLATVFGASPRMRLDLMVNDFVYKAITDGYIILFENQFKRNFVHVRDVARAFIFMINNYDFCKGQIFNLGLSNENLTKLELAERIKLQVPNFEIMLKDFKTDPDKRNYIISNDKIEKLGYKTIHSLDDGIEELIKLYTIISANIKKYSN